MGSDTTRLQPSLHYSILETGIPSRTLTSNLGFRTLLLCALSYGDKMVRASGNAPDPGTHLVGFRL